MAVYFFLHSVLYAFAIYCTAEKIIEKLQGEIIDDVLREIIKYVAAQSGDNLAVASIRRPLGYLLSIAGLYIAKQIGESVVEKIKGYAVEKIGEYVVAPVRDSVVAPIRRKLGYLLFYKSNIKDFRTQMENLKDTRDKVQGRVDDAKRNGEVILPIVREWLKNVNKVVEESINIFEDGLLLNLKLRYQRSRNAKEKTSDVDKLTREGNSFDRVSTYALAFKSRKFIFDEVMEAVKDDGIGMIGIYGLGGVGKTTLAKEVQQQANDGNLFDKVVMPVVSQSPDSRRIQGDIADKLRLKLDAEGIPGRAEQLSKRLKEIKKILVILDDVWKRIDLEAIGIPFGEKHRGCKILLTSRSKEVCNDCHEVNTTQKNFSIEVLTEEEGWKLFRKIAGDSVDSPDLRDLASEVSKECAGLPITIVTVARELRDKPSSVWHNVLHDLRNSTHRKEDAEVFDSRELVFKQIMEAVKDDTINMIGIYGIGGVGKTTLVKNAGEQAKDLFDKVVITSAVSQNPDFKKIQGEIADTLGLKFDVETELGRARILSTKLKEIKKILVILDDVWKRVDLEAIGIPFGEKHRGCKILLTSRSKEVCNYCHVVNTTQKNFSIEVLTEEEGWKLFRKMAGDSVDSPDLHDLAFEVSKECAGLPIAIVTVASALQDKPSYVWRNVLHDLRNSTHRKEVFAAIELSYNYLENEEAKDFFLLCCLFPEDYEVPIESLMMYGMGRRLFENVRTVDDARFRAYALADSLKSSCLLQDGWNEEFVKMHDVIRDVAITIASKSKAFLVRAGAGWKEGLQEEDAFKPYDVISLWSDDIHELSVELKCPKLQILLLGSIADEESLSEDGESQISSFILFPANLSLRMENLKVLSIFSIKFLSLSQSFENLKNLRTLCFNDCGLKDISIVGDLKKLEIISLYDSDIEELPKEIGMLTQLKMLDLTGCRNLTVIPSDVILGLSRLEGLYMDDSFDKWEIEREDKERSNASIAELKHLSHLINLEIQIPHADHFPDDLLFKSLSRFKISVGTRLESWRERYSYSKTLKLELNVSTALKNGVKELLRKVEHFHLWGEMKGLKSVVYDLDREGFRDLRCLIVEECSEVEHIFNAAECSELQELRLRKLPRLMNLWKDPTRHVGFRNLTVVKVEECDGLKNLFSHSAAKQLSKVLVKLEVEYCKIMEEIVGNGKEAASVVVDDIVFLHLRSLELRRLPNLRNFCSNVKEDVDTHTQGPLFDKKVSFPQLKVLKVEGCHKVSKVVQFNLLVSLEELDVQECDSLEEVVEVEGLVVEETLNQLRELKLRRLPKLKHIMRCDKYPHGILGFQNLSSIDIYECNSLKSLFSPFIAKCLAQLKEVEIDSCEMMESIIVEEREGEENGEEIIVFPKLCTLKLLNLPKLISFMKTFTSIISIQQKLMKDDEIVKEAPQEGNLCDPIQPLFNEKVAFPVLETLKIEKIGNLIEIWHSQFPVKSFSQLKVLKVRDCHKVSKIVAFNLLKRLLSLEELSIKNCDSVEEIIGVEGLVVEEGHVRETLSQLKKLKLRRLPKLKHIMRWDMYPHRILGFQNLSSINIFECHSLASLFSPSMFSPSMASNLVQLQELEIDSCEMMESIIAEERQGEDCIKIVEFPQLSTLQLKNLPKLISFIQTFTSNFSIQQKLMISDEVSKVATQEGDLGDPIKPLFDKKVSFPQLKVLNVEGCHKVSKVVQFNLLLSLEELNVKECYSLEEIVEVEVEELVVFPQLRLLKLENLPKLISFMKTIQQKMMIKDEIVKEAPQEGNLPDPIQPLFDKKVAFTNLVELQIVNIENLQEIFHTRLADESFSLLRFLKVTECHKLSRVAPSNLLPRLQNLEVLSVERCDSMEKIFELEGEGHTDAISLSQLIRVDLIKLPNLMMFCSGKYGFELPSLENFTFRKCPKMQTFSSGLKGTPKLKKVGQKWYPLQGVWKGDLNSTIHYLVQEEEIKQEIKQRLYVIKDLVDGLHSREQESSVEDEEKDKDEEVGEKSEEANIEEQERKENISAQAVHHEISEETEQEGHRKGSMEAIREHLKVITYLLDELGVEEEEDDEEEEGESEKAGEASIEELQEEIHEHLKGVIELVKYSGGLRKRKHVVVIRKHLKGMMDRVDRFGLREQEPSIVSVPH